MYLVKQVELAVRSHLDDLLRPDGLTALQYTALTVLERHPDMSVGATRPQLLRHRPVHGRHDRHPGRTRSDRTPPDQADRRRLAIALSPSGQKLLDRYRDQVAALESQMLQGITKPQIAALRRSLTACRANLTADQRR